MCQGLHHIPFACSYKSYVECNVRREQIKLIQFSCLKCNYLANNQRIFYISYNTANFVITDIMVFNKTGITV